jgi:hypothetical protein
MVQETSLNVNVKYRLIMILAAALTAIILGFIVYDIATYHQPVIMKPNPNQRKYYCWTRICTGCIQCRECE